MRIQILLWRWFGCMLAVASFLMWPSTTLATATAGWSNSFIISEIGPREGFFDLHPDRAVTSSMGCSLTGVVRIYMTASNYEAITSSTITAYASGKLVHFWIASCDSDGTPVATALWVGS